MSPFLEGQIVHDKNFVDARIIPCAIFIEEALLNAIRSVSTASNVERVRLPVGLLMEAMTSTWFQRCAVATRGLVQHLNLGA